MVFNLQLLCFIEKNIKNLYKKIKIKFKNYKYNNFLIIVKKNGQVKNICKYNDLIQDENNKKIFKFTNNITENINKQLNKCYIQRNYITNN